MDFDEMKNAVARALSLSDDDNDDVEESDEQIDVLSIWIR